MSHFKAKIHRIDFGWDSAPDPAGGAYSASQTSSSDLMPTSNGSREEPSIRSHDLWRYINLYVCMRDEGKGLPRPFPSPLIHTYKL